jgi:hypothetical protein
LESKIESNLNCLSPTHKVSEETFLTPSSPIPMLLVGLIRTTTFTDGSDSRGVFDWVEIGVSECDLDVIGNDL